MNKLLAIVPVIVVLMGIGAVSAAPVVSENDVPDYRTAVKEVRSGGKGIQFSMLWDESEKMYSLVKYYNGFFVGKVRYMDTNKLVSPKKFWGVYNNGYWIGFLGKAKSENLVYGKYKAWNNGWLSYWTLTNLDGGTIRGYGIHMFT